MWKSKYKLLKQPIVKFTTNSDSFYRNKPKHDLYKAT